MVSKARRIIETLREVSEYYEVVYYEKVGQHGSAGSYPKFDWALKAAKDIPVDEGTWYVGVEGNGNQFAVVHITQEYIDHVGGLGSDAFGDSKAAAAWAAAAKKALETGQPVTGKW